MSNSQVVQLAVALFVMAAGPGLVALALFVRGLAERIDELESLRLLDAAERAQLHRELNELRRGISILIAQVRRAGMVPEWTPEAMPVTYPRIVTGQQAETDRLVTLWQRIADRFSMEEIADLAFRLGLPESRADTAGAAARELVNNARRRGLLDRLDELCRDERPSGGF
jgi:hypothetical protein